MAVRTRVYDDDTSDVANWRTHVFGSRMRVFCDTALVRAAKAYNRQHRSCILALPLVVAPRLLVEEQNIIQMQYCVKSEESINFGWEYVYEEHRPSVSWNPSE